VIKETEEREREREIHAPLSLNLGEEPSNPEVVEPRVSHTQRMLLVRLVHITVKNELVWHGECFLSVDNRIVADEAL
jgi:hypothetical protein